ncbi:hypothetical protein EON65_29885, partial [archaeon]
MYEFASLTLPFSLPSPQLREKGRLGMLDSAFEVSGDGELFSLPPRITSKQLSLLGDISLADPVLGEIIA